MSTKVDEETSVDLDEETSVDLKKREFMGKAGKYAVAGAGMAILMTPKASTANSYQVYKNIVTT